MPAVRIQSGEVPSWRRDGLPLTTQVRGVMSFTNNTASNNLCSPKDRPAAISKTQYLSSDGISPS